MRHDADRPPAAPTRTRRMVARSRRLQAQASERILAARDEHVAIRLVSDALREDRDTGGALLAGALAFRLFMWLLPAALLGVAVLGFFNPDSLRQDMTGAGLGGFAAETIAQATAQAKQARWLLLLIGLVALYSTSVGLARALWIGTTLAWHLPVAKLRQPAKAAGCVVALLVPAVALTLAANWLRTVAYGPGLTVTLAMLVLYTLLGWVVLRLLPRPLGVSAVDLIPGAILIGLGIQVLHLVSALYLVNRISTSSQIYGALGGAATLLIWGYLLARILVGASTLNHTLVVHRDTARLPGGDGLPRSLAVNRLPAFLADWRGLLPGAGGTRASRSAGEPAPDDAETTQAATLTVWRFEDEDGADQASRTLGDLEEQGFIRVIDAAVVTWPSGARKPRTSQVYESTASGALGGSFWGLLFGLIFFAPLLGLAVGAATGALSGSLRGVGISDDFIRRVRSEVTPGTSALFLMTSDARLEEVHTAFLAHHPTLIHTNLTEEQEAALRTVFTA